MSTDVQQQVNEGFDRGPLASATVAETAPAAEIKTPEEKKPPVEIKVAPTPIKVDEKTQMVVAQNQSDLVRMIRIFMKGQALPKTLNTEEKVITAWQAAASLGLPPVVAIKNMAIIHGSLAIWGELPKALAEATGQLEDFQLLYVDKEYNEISLVNKNLNAEVWAAVVRIKRKGRSMNEYFFTRDEAQKAGLLNKDGPWKDFTKIMLARRAMGQGWKFEFPDALNGLNIAEYDHHEAPDIKDVTPGRNTADLLNKGMA